MDPVIAVKSPQLVIRDLSLRYRTRGGAEVVAIEGLSMDVAEETFSVIVGPSGCGKSSLLYLIGGLAEQTSGEILLEGEPVDGPGPDRGMVFQSYTLFPWLTVQQNIAYGLKRKGINAAECSDIVRHYIESVGLSGFADHYPKQLSGGMMQRVAIARALANDPKILLMDEPFGALDSQTRMSMQELLLRVWEEKKKTVIFVTHDIEEALILGDTITVMKGRPGAIRSTIEVDFPRPRDMEMIMEPRFVAMKRDIFHALHDGEKPGI